MKFVFVILAVLVHYSSGKTTLPMLSPLPMLSRFGAYPYNSGIYGGMHGALQGMPTGYGGMPGHLGGFHPNHHRNPMMQQLLVYQLLEKYQAEVIKEIEAIGVTITATHKPLVQKTLQDFSRKMLMVAELLHQQQENVMPGFYGF